MAEYLIQEQSLTAVADAIRAKTGKNDLLTLENMPSEIANIEAGIDTSDATATSSHILSGETAYVNGEKITGNIATKTSSDLTVSGATVTVPVGYYGSQASKSVATATQATPSISVSSAGLITASATQSAGYVTAGTKSATKQLTVQAAQTITPGTSNKTIASGRYLTGTQTIAGDADLVAGNIKKGVNIFGVAGSYDAASAALNFNVVGGTSKPSNPAENTIWISTSTAISGWEFSATTPTSSTSGKVWICTGSSSPADFNALKSNAIQVYPTSAKQYVNNAWVSKDIQIYLNGKWNDVKAISDFSYDGTYITTTDAEGNWEIHLQTSGTFKFNNLNSASRGIEVFLVGGGGNGAKGSDSGQGGGGGGGGGYTSTTTLIPTQGQNYPITIGGSAGATSGFGAVANAGGNGTQPGYMNVNGGAGGAGTGNGGAGATGGSGKGGDGGDGVYAFGGTSGTRYGGGGGGSCGSQSVGGGGKGGASGGGAGGASSSASGSAGVANTGGGGGGGYSYGSNGGSGIIIIRNKRG